MSTSYVDQDRAAPEAALSKAREASEWGHVLYICDFPPSNYRGGTVTMSRLLGGYPAERLTVLSSSYENSIAPREGRLSCQHLIFPTTNQTGRWGVGRLKALLDWFLIPVLVAVALGAVIRHRSTAMITIAHGYFFVAASAASLLSNVPLILVVHDDWVTATRSTSYILRWFARPLFRLSSRQAAHVYAVSPGMQSMLKEKFGIESELQLPVAGPRAPHESDPVKEETSRTGPLRIVYAGTLSLAVDDAFDLLIELVRSDKLRELGLDDWELHLYVLATPQQAVEKGWNNQRIVVHGWVGQDEVASALARADVLFLPFSFREDQRFATEQAFPAKTSDYLSSGKPIVVFAPAYSSVARYAREYDCAEVIDEPDLDLLARAIVRVASSAEYRLRLSTNARRAFTSNHDLIQQQSRFRALVSGLAVAPKKNAGLS
jgi:glycosyltransferase involved in cell wall biosynthesis